MVMEKYLEEIHRLLDRVAETQGDKIKLAAARIADAIEGKNGIYAFGCNHAGILAMELFYRTGGLAVINPILAPGLNLDTYPVTLTTEMERLNDYGRCIIDCYKLKKGDVLIIHSVSGRNSVPIDAAIRAGELGIYTIGLTNISTSENSISRHVSGKKLYEVCDLVIDNCGCFGDAALQVEGLPERIAPTSTVIGAAILNAMVAESVALMLKRGIIPPVFISSNVEGGDKHNSNMLDAYRENIMYA